jgi:hypothetical protein
MLGFGLSRWVLLPPCWLTFRSKPGRHTIAPVKARFLNFRPTVRAAFILVLVSVVVFVGWRIADADWVDAWIPNIVVGLLTVAVTITFVESIVEREHRNRVHPRINRTLAHLALSLQRFAQSVLMDYAMTHVRTEQTIDGDLMEILARWTNDPSDDEARGRNTTALLFEAGCEFARVAKSLADADRLDLPQDLVAAIDGLDATLHTMLTPEAPLRWSCLVIVGAALPVAATLRPHVDGDHFRLFEGTTTFPAVPEGQ